MRGSTIQAAQTKFGSSFKVWAHPKLYRACFAGQDTLSRVGPPNLNPLGSTYADSSYQPKNGGSDDTCVSMAMARSCINSPAFSILKGNCGWVIGQTAVKRNHTKKEKKEKWQIHKILVTKLGRWKAKLRCVATEMMFISMDDKIDKISSKVEGFFLYFFCRWRRMKWWTRQATLHNLQRRVANRVRIKLVTSCNRYHPPHFHHTLGEKNIGFGPGRYCTQAQTQITKKRTIYWTIPVSDPG